MSCPQPLLEDNFEYTTQLLTSKWQTTGVTPQTIIATNYVDYGRWVFFRSYSVAPALASQKFNVPANGEIRVAFDWSGGGSCVTQGSRVEYSGLYVGFADLGSRGKIVSGAVDPRDYQSGQISTLRDSDPCGAGGWVHVELQIFVPAFVQASKVSLQFGIYNQYFARDIMIDNVLVCPLTPANRIAPIQNAFGYHSGPGANNSLSVFLDKPSTAVAWGDYNNDGNLDLAVTTADETLGQQLRVWRNDLTNSRFVEVNVGI